MDWELSVLWYMPNNLLITLSEFITFEQNAIYEEMFSVTRLYLVRLKINTLICLSSVKQLKHCLGFKSKYVTQKLSLFLLSKITLFYQCISTIYQ